jgi:hypothetical protein
MDFSATIELQDQLIADIENRLRWSQHDTTVQAKALSKRCSIPAVDCRELLARSEENAAVLSRLLEVESLTRQLAVAKQQLQQIRASYLAASQQPIATIDAGLTTSRGNKPQQLNNNSIIFTLLLFSSITCLFKVDLSYGRCSNIHACDMAVSKQPLTGSNLPVSSINSKIVTAFYNRETVFVVDSAYLDTCGSGVVFTRAAIRAFIYIVADALVTIFDPGGLRRCSDVTLLELPT